MASEFPGRPAFLKGALVVFETPAPTPTNLILFQYNPETMTRSFQTQYEEKADWWDRASDTGRVLPPTESFQLTIELDAADQLERANPVAMTDGLHPTLAALELLLYPNSTLLFAADLLADSGSAIVTPAETPVVLFVWGAARVVPVRVGSISVTELAFDQLLNPIQARVDLNLRSLTNAELGRAKAPFDTLAKVQIVAKEILARKNVNVAGAKDVRDLLPF